MEKKKKGRRIALAIVCAVLLLAALACFLTARSLSRLLPDQYAAERWAGEGESAYRQVSCYLTVDEPVDLNQIYAFRYAILDRLHEAGLEADTHTRLFRDAWCLTGKMEASSDLAHGQVSVIAVGGDFFLFHPLRLLNGSYLTEDDLMEDRVLLDEEAAWLLFGGTELSGMSIKLNGVPFVVSGVVERERDFASRKAYTAGRGVYMSYAAYTKMNEGAAAGCYELVLVEPVKDFTLSFVKEKFPIGQGEIVENSQRFSLGRRLELLGHFGERSMQKLGVIYPYWENAARCVEDWCALLTLLGMLFLAFPAALGLILLVRGIRRGKEKLSDELLPGVKNKLDDAVQKRRHKKWDKEHGVPQKDESSREEKDKAEETPDADKSENNEDSKAEEEFFKRKDDKGDYED
jgi:hypothetical protein